MIDINITDIVVFVAGISVLMVTYTVCVMSFVWFLNKE